ncbi:recombinase family protein [Deinococcus hopiensis]|uniref:Site-specific recombinases, DNA invertase Pin homologs n=1 Tax=Deinococcus hopiensis KR-140 TaxID=695939 RepID=A0A1W1UUF8_9DEIO|nr:recombinase family protein [Deinococcus hopiensis]SMB84629.1 Site-specific recombinases, DNA invertase Pin homologs [Deinococcus hopiensis KR-140]
MLIGYVRSAELLELPFTQATRLMTAGCQVIYIEMSSGDHLQRPVLHRAVESLRPSDVLLVSDSDRLSRNDLQMEILLRRIRVQQASLHLLGPEGEVLGALSSSVLGRPHA